MVHIVFNMSNIVRVLFLVETYFTEARNNFKRWMLNYTFSKFSLLQQTPIDTKNRKCHT